MSRDDDIYSRVRKVRLKSRGSREQRRDGNIVGIPGQSSEGEIFRTNSSVEEMQPKKGQGRIITSNITVQGFHTKFMQELKPGDTLIIEHPNTLIKESRVVMSIVSERTLILDREFSSDLISTSEYYFVQSSNNPSESGEASSFAVNLPKSTSTYSYREKQGMFKYKTVVKPMSSELSREEILDIRTKKQRDKYCWI